ncbi:delta(3,5)-Delta(2,4)-dienoyl-CoA isomerase, mitochondrial [Oratosquilla oratoria]|uniref:delta(3,5)-Delta(2,4)-dienoyl-CoA isomerase, mitochondrial n=1 Tax=Oratosquilla oratoria TaxID=337810 RepID=UPI003F75AD40
MFRALRGIGYRVPQLLGVRTMAMDAPQVQGYNYETLLISNPREHVFHVQLNRPESLNAMNSTLWTEIGECFNRINEDSDCRSVVLSGAGRIFTAGLDISDMGELVATVMGDDDIARKSRVLFRMIKKFQDSFTALEKCPKPVIAAVHSGCIGGGVDLICAADIRYCSRDAWFQIKEVDIGLAADIGTLQRLPKIVGNESLVRELTYSARKMFSYEALQCGLVSRMFTDKDELLTGALDMASTIASKSPVAVQGSKVNLIYARDHTVQEGLDYIACMNQAMLQSEDVRIAAMAAMSRSKDKPSFSKL